MFPLQLPFALPMHQVRFVAGTGFDEEPYVPVALNCTCPLGKFWASATAGLKLTEFKWLPHPMPMTASITAPHNAIREDIDSLLITSDAPDKVLGCPWGWNLERETGFEPATSTL